MGNFICIPREEDEDHYYTQPYIGRKFYSSTSAGKSYSKYASDYGFTVCKEEEKWEENIGRQRAHAFACDSEDCQAKMCISMDDSVGMYRVFLFIKDHTHPLNPKQEVSISETTEFYDEINKPGTVYEYMKQNKAFVHEYIKQTLYRNEVDNVEKRREMSIEVLSWEPTAILYHNFLSEEECKHLIDIANPHMKRSCVTCAKTGQPIVNCARTSFSMSVPQGHTKIVSEIEKRIAEFTCVPKEHGASALAVIRYEVGQKVVPHHDYLVRVEGFNTHRGGQLIATFLMYLSDVEEGGETIFPSAKGNNITLKKGLVVKPKMGNALLFWSLKPDGTLDSSTLHESSPVIKGTKWSCTKVLHVGKV